ncbi:MAG: trypsin-like peptidase domain-containing protein [Longimicrobiales bacterium]
MSLRNRHARWVAVVVVVFAAGPAVALYARDGATPDDAVVERLRGDAAPAPFAQVAVAQQAVEGERRNAIVRAAQRTGPAVVSVNTVRRQTVRPRTIWEQMFLGPGASREVPGLGSGFIIDAAGLILTNEHVVRGADEVVVTLTDGTDLPAEIVGTDEVTDLALLRVQSPPDRQLPVAPLGTSSNLVIGEWAIAIGNPFGFLLSNAEPTVTAGVISGVGRNIIPDASGDERGFYLDMIQTDASINPGNSGGPLINALGEVIGVNSSIISGSGGSIGLGFAIPIDRARRVAAALLENGVVRRAWAGVTLETGEADRFGRTRDVRIASVAPGSPAAAAGLRPGDVIISVNGRRVGTPLDWEARLLDTPVGQSLQVVLTTGGEQRTVSVTTQPLPSLTAERVEALSDLELVTVTPSIRAERRLASEQGALIVELSDVARSVGLAEGDVIVQINRVPVATAEDAASLLRQLAGGAARLIIERRGQYGSVSFTIGQE